MSYLLSPLRKFRPLPPLSRPAIVLASLWTGQEICCCGGRGALLTTDPGFLCPMGDGGAGKVWFIIPVLLWGQLSIKWSPDPHARHNPFALR